MTSSYLNKLKFPFYFGIERESFRLRSIRKRRANKDRRSLEAKIQSFEFCTPYCKHASFPDVSELCQYAGMLKCSKHGRLVGKYAPCLNKKKEG